MRRFSSALVHRLLSASTSTSLRHFPRRTAASSEESHGTSRFRQYPPPQQRALAGAISRSERTTARPDVRNPERGRSLPGWGASGSQPWRVVRPDRWAADAGRVLSAVVDRPTGARPAVSSQDHCALPLAVGQARSAHSQESTIAPTITVRDSGLACAPHELGWPRGNCRREVLSVDRLLRTICNSAVSEHEIARNPCTIPGAGQESSPERPTATLPQVLALADEVGEIWRALVILAAFCSLRIGELAALTRSDIDPIHGTVTVRASASDAGGIRQGTTNDQPSTNTGRVQTGWSGQLGLLPRLRGADPDVPEGHPRASPSLDLTCAPTPHDLGACVARIVSPSAPFPPDHPRNPTDDTP